MRQRRVLKVMQFIAIVLLIAIAIWLINHYGVSQLQTRVEQLGVWAPLGIFLLRFTSVVIPALPGTAYAILSGGLLGFTQGILVIGIADLLSCSLSFLLARQFGRGLVQRLVGASFMERIDSFSKRHLERNFFMMTGCLMTGFFDFVCYGLGLTKAPWYRFVPALVVSIALSDPPMTRVWPAL